MREKDQKKRVQENIRGKYREERKKSLKSIRDWQGVGRKWEREKKKKKEREGKSEGQNWKMEERERERKIAIDMICEDGKKREKDNSKKVTREVRKY